MRSIRTKFLQYSLLLAVLFFLATPVSSAQSVELWPKYYLTGNNPVTLNYFTKDTQPASPKVETVHIRTTTSGGSTEEITKVTTTLPESGSTAKVKHYGAITFNPNETAFSVEHKKDTLILRPISYVDTITAGGTPDLNTRRAWNASRATHTYFIAIPKRIGYVPLRSTAREYGVVAIPFRLYLTINSGLKAKPVLGAGVAAYYGRSRSTHYFHDDGTSIKLTRTKAAYLGFSQVSVKPSNTDNKVATESDEPAVTLGYAYLLGRGDLKIGYVIGTDLPLTKAGWKWDFSPAVYVGAVVSLSISPLTIK